MAKVALSPTLDGDDHAERPEGVRTQWMPVTPDWATKQLDAYEKFCDTHPSERKNRPVHQAQVTRYAEDMKAGKCGLARASVMGAVARAWYTQDKDKLQRFVDVLAHGITQHDDEHVIITLRNWLMTYRNAGSSAARESYGKTSRALLAYLNGER